MGARYVLELVYRFVLASVDLYYSLLFLLAKLAPKMPTEVSTSGS